MTQSKSKAVVDFAGRPSWLTTFKSANKPMVYQMDASTEGTTYIRFDAETGGSVIQRIQVADGITTVMIAFGAWADRATLDFQEPNLPLVIDSDKVAKIWARI